MNHTPIEWVKNPDGTSGYTLNSKTGCLNHTPDGLCCGGGFPCYAYRLANGRLKDRYLKNKNIAPIIDNQNLITDPSEEDAGDPFYPRFRIDDLLNLYRVQKPLGIFLDDMSDWMGDYWPERWTRLELKMMNDNPQHRIYTLTKQPQNLVKFSPFPPNCWVGVTATNNDMTFDAVNYLADVQANVRFLSFEPLLAPINLVQLDVHFKGTIDWLIIGACTGRKAEIKALCQRDPELTPMPWGKIWTAQPPFEWVAEIVQAADKAGVKVFLKNNLKSLVFGDYVSGQCALDVGLLNWDGDLRQEMPDAR